MKKLTTSIFLLMFITLTVEPIMSVVDFVSDANGTREVANAYADVLFT